MNSPATGSGGPPQTREAYRASVNQWRQQALSERNHYEARVRRQIQQYFEHYSAPWYCALLGFRSRWNLLVAESRVTGAASTLGRGLEDEEAKAMAEHTLSNLHLNVAFKYVMLGFAGYMTYRGRRTWQFPFYKPKLGGKFNPYEATSIIGGKKIRGFYPQFLWHSLRFSAYATVAMLMGEPLFRAINFTWTEQAMAQDPRLKQFTKDASARVEEVLHHGPYARQQAPQQSKDEQSYNTGYEEKQNYDQPYVPETPSWNDMSRPPQSQSTSSQQPDDKWDSVFDDDDDASPIAGSARTQSQATYSGSAWDRVRQQTQANRRPQQEAQNSWSKVSQQSQSSWGNENAGTSPEYRGPRESYAYSKAEEESATPKEQAQQEFDRLLEKERQGVDQGRAWGRR